MYVSFRYLQKGWNQFTWILILAWKKGRRLSSYYHERCTAWLCSGCCLLKEATVSWRKKVMNYFSIFVGFFFVPSSEIGTAWALWVSAASNKAQAAPDQRRKVLLRLTHTKWMFSSIKEQKNWDRETTEEYYICVFCVDNSPKGTPGKKAPLLIVADRIGKILFLRLPPISIALQK